MVFDGKWFFISILLLVEVYCRPQNNENIAEQSVEYSIFPVQLRLPRWLPQPDLQRAGFSQIFNYPVPIGDPSNSILHPFPNEIINRKTLGNYETPKNLLVSTKNNLITNDKEAINNLDKPQSHLPVNSQLNSQKPPSLAPYRFHPLLNYIKNGNTIQMDKVIHLRNSDKVNDDVTTLILKPVARSVAGPNGKAMATPVSKAILRKGTSVDILFEPDAIAIAGPGGIAHAQSDLEISYEDI